MITKASRQINNLQQSKYKIWQNKIKISTKNLLYWYICLLFLKAIHSKKCYWIHPYSWYRYFLLNLKTMPNILVLRRIRAINIKLRVFENIYGPQFQPAATS